MRTVESQLGSGRCEKTTVRTVVNSKGAVLQKKRTLAQGEEPPAVARADAGSGAHAGQREAIVDRHDVRSGLPMSTTRLEAQWLCVDLFMALQAFHPPVSLKKKDGLTLK
jgi:hypothetical protein